MTPRSPLRMTSLTGACLTVATLGALLAHPQTTVAAAPTTSRIGAQLAVSAPVAAPAQQARARRRAVNTRWTTQVAEQDERVTVRGRVPRRHRRAVLQVRADGRWLVRDRAATPERRYRFVVPTSDLGRFTYRVVAPVNRAQRRSGLRRGLSAPTTIRVVRARPAEARGEASDFSYISSTPARWNPCDTITYRVNAARGPATALRDARGAVERIEVATGLDFEYVGPTKLVPQENSGQGYPRDTQIVIAWAGRDESRMISSDSVAGVGGPMGWHGNVDESGAPILTWSQGTVVLNSDFGWLEPGFGTGATLGKLVMHELGHVVGLGHAATEMQVMFPTLQREHPSDWGAGDRAGLQSLGAEQGCIYTPEGAPASHMRAGAVSVVSRVTADRL